MLEVDAGTRSETDESESALLGRNEQDSVALQMIMQMIVLIGFIKLPLLMDCYDFIGNSSNLPKA